MTTNNLEVRLLKGPNEWQQAMDLMRTHTHISGVPAAQFDWKQFDGFLYDNLVYAAHPEYRVIGALEADKLKGFVVQLVGNINNVWYMTMIVQEHTGWLGNGHGDYVNACLMEAASYAESQRHWDCLCAIPYKWGRTAKRTQPRSPVWSRYELFIDGVYPANTVPKFGQHAVAVGGPKPHAVVIKRASLKMEHRMAYYAEDGYDVSKL